MKHALRSLVTALALASVTAAGCDLRPEDFGPVQTATTRFGEDATTRAGELEHRLAALLQRAQSVPPTAPGIADLQTKLGSAKNELEALTAKIDSTRAEVDTQVQARRRRLAEEALARNTRDLQAAAASIAATLDEVGAALDALDAQSAAAAKAPAAASSVADPAFAHATGSIDVPGIAFVSGTADLDLAAPTTKAALDDLLAFASSCEQLRFSLTGHTARDGDERINARLSRAQADAVRAYLERMGVAKDKIAQVDGVGGSEPRVPEPAAGSPEEKAMKTDELAAIRAQNRRISVTVTAPCSTPS